MLMGDKRAQVIENIRQAAQRGTFNSKVELDDPVLTAAQKEALLDAYLTKRSTIPFRMGKQIARHIVRGATRLINHKTEIIGLEHTAGITGGAILTSNHFSQIDNTVVRTLAEKLGKKTLYIVSQESNLAMPGLPGFLLNHADTLPISSDRAYLSGRFAPMLKELLDQNNYVLIYPEQEMWFHYRKPRPMKRGAYYYAAKFNVPVISCFVEIRDLEKRDTPEFRKTQYIMHVLPPIFPDPLISVRENSISMCQKDYRQKRAAYEAAYGKPLDYRFEPDDIAGWIPPARVWTGAQSIKEH